MPRTSQVKTITRQHFLRALVNNAGLKFVDAAKAYQVMSDLFADSIVTGQKIVVGKVLSISPSKKAARKVVMNFRNKKQTIHLGNRLNFKVSIFKEFLNKHQINWKL
jgi:Bacterial DNA-binding protein